MIIGVDPGSRDGAAVALCRDGKTIDSWVAWWTLKRKSGPQMMAASGGTRTRMEVTGVSDALKYVSGGCALVVVEELLSIRGPRMNPKTLIPLAEAAGEAIGRLAPYSTGGVRRVDCHTWRRVVLGLGPRTGADVAEDQAVRLAPQMYDWSGCWHGWGKVDGLPKVARGAVAEAACIARWGHVQGGAA